MRYLKNVLAVIGSIAIVIGLFRLLLPLAISDRTITEGSYRGLEVGVYKDGIANRILDRNELELYGFASSNDGFEFASFDKFGDRIMASSVWYVQVDGIHRENIELTFEGDELAQIRFTRNTFDP